MKAHALLEWTVVLLANRSVVMGPDGKQHPVKAGDTITVKVLRGGKYKVVPMPVPAPTPRKPREAGPALAAGSR
jgi:hypothetical protein